MAHTQAQPVLGQPHPRRGLPGSSGPSSVRLSLFCQIVPLFKQLPTVKVSLPPSSRLCSSLLIAVNIVEDAAATVAACFGWCWLGNLVVLVLLLLVVSHDGCREACGDRGGVVRDVFECEIGVYVRASWSSECSVCELFFRRSGGQSDVGL